MTALDRICSNTNSCDEAYVTVVVGLSDIAVVKTVNPTHPAIGGNVAFTVTVTNKGPHAAAGVRVIDLLPVGYTFTSATATGGSYSSASGNWMIGDLGINSPRTLTINAVLKTTGPYTNTAKASSLMHDPDLTNNTSTTTPATVPSAIVSTTCIAGNSVQQVRVDLTGDPDISGWTVRYTYESATQTVTNIQTSPFTFQPAKPGTIGNGWKRSSS